MSLSASSSAFLSGSAVASRSSAPGASSAPVAAPRAILQTKARPAAPKTRKAALPAKKTRNSGTGKWEKAGRKMEDVKAQQFKLTLPGGLFQSQRGIEKTVTLGFSKANELFVGRVAMLGFASSVIGELLTGKGAMGQFGLETGIPLQDTEPLILAVVGFNLLAAFAGTLGFTKGEFVPDAEELVERPNGALQSAAVTPFTPGKFLGIQGLGFTKLNELFVGRVAMLGMASSLLGEAITGNGPLAQFDFETGIPLADTEPLLAASIVFFLFTAINPGSGKFVEE